MLLKAGQMNRTLGHIGGVAVGIAAVSGFLLLNAKLGCPPPPEAYQLDNS